jgi:hypothetical protein
MIEAVHKVSAQSAQTRAYAARLSPEGTRLPDFGGADPLDAARRSASASRIQSRAILSKASRMVGSSCFFFSKLNAAPRLLLVEFN